MKITISGMFSVNFQASQANLCTRCGFKMFKVIFAQLSRFSDLERQSDVLHDPNPGRLTTTGRPTWESIGNPVFFFSLVHIGDCKLTLDIK